MSEDFRLARAKIRAAVRNRLAVFDGHDIWQTDFFVSRIDLASEIIPFLNVMRTKGPAKAEDLLDIVREEFMDFVVLQDDQHTVQVTEIVAVLKCEKCHTDFHLK